jgi:hypothetical protein
MWPFSGSRSKYSESQWPDSYHYVSKSSSGEDPAPAPLGKDSGSKRRSHAPRSPKRNIYSDGSQRQQVQEQEPDPVPVAEPVTVAQPVSEKLSEQVEQSSERDPDTFYILGDGNFKKTSWIDHKNKYITFKRKPISNLEIGYYRKIDKPSYIKEISSGGSRLTKKMKKQTKKYKSYKKRTIRKKH